MIATPARPTWEEFALHLGSPAPIVVRLRGQPAVDLFGDSNGERIGLRVRSSDLTRESLPDSPFTALQIELVHLEEGDHLEVATSTNDLFPYFFAFALSIADGVQLDGATPGGALRRSLRDWRSLFEQLALLTPERQLGLLGELWMLDRLMDLHGAAALDAWTGPKREAHDFRVGQHEFEVKATSSERRSHLISGDSQLVASPGHDLYLLSLQFAAGGPGARSLQDVIEAARDRMAVLHLGSRFDDVLESTFQLLPSTLGHYKNRLQLRSPPCLVPVDETFPRITHDDMLSLQHLEMARVSDVRYRVDVDGLGWEDGTPEFLAVLPGGPT